MPKNSSGGSSVRIAAAYIRVSTDDQVEYSPESQLKVIRDYAKRNNFVIPGDYIFMDEGISGRKAEKRPAFMQMIGLAKSKPKPFDAIILWKFSRFARNREDSIVYKSMLRKQLGIEVLSVSESLGDDKMSILIEALIEAMDEYYSINLAEEVKRGMTEKARRGEPLSIPPFGYTMKNKQLEIVPEEAAVVRAAFEKFVGGKGMVGIAKELNALGVRTHRGSKIENRTVEYWLNNPVYIGKIRWTPTGSTSRNYSNPDSMIVDGTHEPLIGVELWDQAQEKLKAIKIQYRKYIKPRDSISHWLVGLIHCDECGGIVVNCAGNYYCNNKNKGTCPGNGSINAKKISQYVISALENFSNGATDGVSVAYKKTELPEKSDADMYAAMLYNAEQRLRRVREAYEAGIDTLEEYSTNKAKLTAEIESIKEQIKPAPSPNLEDRDAELRLKIADVLSIVKDPDKSNVEKNTAVRTVVSNIVKKRDEIAVNLFI
ncbi:MAG: recombinase family protein [Oscillospiraceae bacterium]|nr:recombinase family protein [Oscillospiraceae bacterium]